MKKSKPNGKKYQGDYNKAHPLLSSRVSLEVYDEVKRRAKLERRSISQFLAMYLEALIFSEQPAEREKRIRLGIEAWPEGEEGTHGA